MTQECSLKLRSETASRTTPAASRPGLDENFVKRLEELELKMAAAKEHSAQTKALFTMNDLLQKKLGACTARDGDPDTIEDDLQKIAR